MSFENFVDDVWTDESILKFTPKKVNKQLSQILHELNHTPKNVLNCSWKNAAGIALEDQGISVDTEPREGKQYDTILALDEYFTYFSTEEDQRNEIFSKASLMSPGGIMLTSIRDYRNNPVHKRFLGDTSYININDSHHVVVEINTPNSQQNQTWHQINFIIKDGESAVAYEIGDRRTLYFKQLAKYCKDAGSNQFGVIKENFWKAPWRRTTEHITWTRF
jgi:hypothetical protein